MATLANERITTRVNSETKELLERALSLSGYASLNSFIANAAVAEAKRLIEQNMRIRLCQEDALAFVDALERPATTMNDRFLRAARKHKETIRNEDRTSR
ncbi:TPA: DUF1778 domain-containing protein [Vibrio parahaemolyticus]|uniref:type II toxin-antitoxin system TacA family antitoxin n=1 Tax=Vibrio parahaemolyticus TaxID=670 RepID=UPI000761F5D8|nr:DUF1778 domain-containing protein [Vibrio parahaemolyticus]KWU29477.1 hypothetical protein AVL52_23365 [Vibrio parahaemolyticus]HCE4720479.1 DUF1778 domain-containing protein [Vibrio parahaemolyticus]HCE4828449.1 DUF1778 domain-containing protein [Vibrio parahaemolyticus]HCE5279551.1 DUF1778 domain-containing protein [Vibrio parahaemolyticus]HCG8122536.1 DUF1778 domain-containing protein [Vibrio parahaemolyticus]